MRQVILDVETKKAFSEVGGYDPKKLGISFVGVVVRDKFHEPGEERGFFEKELNKLWPIMEQADVLVGYNIWGFDLPVLGAYYPGEISQFMVVDMLERVKEKIGYRVSLNAVASQTLGVQKSGSGLDALRYYELGELNKLASYCMDDVRITRDIYDYGLKNKQIKFLNKWNRIIELPVNFEAEIEESTGVQMTLA